MYILDIHLALTALVIVVLSPCILYKLDRISYTQISCVINKIW